jgi:hypothetical protein
MNPLVVKVIELVADEQHDVDEEEKVSSSSLRKRLLGTLIRPPKTVLFALQLSSHELLGVLFIYSCLQCFAVLFEYQCRLSLNYKFI